MLELVKLIHNINYISKRYHVMGCVKLNRGELDLIHLWFEFDWCLYRGDILSPPLMWKPID